MEETKTELQLIKLSEIQSQEVSWLWFPFIPYGIILLSRYQFNNYPTHPARQTSRVFPCPFGKTQSCSDVRPGQ